MSTDPIPATEQARPIPGRFPGAPSLALTFIFAGVGYAFPIWLFAQDYPLNGPVSPEILNLNFLVAWMGLAHFVFAYSGQAKTLRRTGGSAPLLFGASLLIGGAVLAFFRMQVSLRIFDSVIWVYFIPHFIKAELHFIKNCQPELCPSAWVLYWFPAVGFAFFTFALFGPISISFNTGVLIAVAGLCIVAALAGRVLQQLSEPAYAPFALLGFFFIGEGLVWGTYSKFMTPQFRQGLYVFHIAVASFYHYFRAYGFALRKMPRKNCGGYLLVVAVVNLVLIAIGVCVAWHPAWRYAHYLFGLPYFTFWVGLHLISSDIFSGLRAGLKIASAPVTVTSP
jgi:hypothetical protein